MASLFPAIDQPKSYLGYHRVLSPTASVRVSPLCLGAMNFGETWKGYLGECSKETAFGMLDYFYENGGNFIDTANNYQEGESEAWLGEWMKSRGVRDEMVLATKYTTGYVGHGHQKIKANFMGNGVKSLYHSVEHSLKQLQTEYIDLLYIHWWDWTTSIPEVMQALNHLVQQRKVFYLGISDTPAWIVSKANQYARDHGLAQFVVYQGLWNAGTRDFERDIIPMARDEGMALAPWGALGRGRFKTKEQLEASKNEGRSVEGIGEMEVKITEALNKIAQAKGSEITSVALAYVMHKTPYVFPIVGGRKIEHLKANIEALKLELSEEDIEAIESAHPFDAGFPMAFLYGKYSLNKTAPDAFLVRNHARLVEPERLQAIRPSQIAKTHPQE